MERVLEDTALVVEMAGDAQRVAAGELGEADGTAAAGNADAEARESTAD